MRIAALAAQFAAFLLLTFNPARAQLPPAVQARSWILVDATSKQTLAAGNPEQRVEPASLTKLMTAYLAFDALKYKRIAMAQAVIPSDAVRRVRHEESQTFIEANKPITVHDLLYGMIVQSGNDAAIALAELLGGSEENFVALMNRTAQRLGMRHTHYANVNGLSDAQHYTSASDIALLSIRLIQDFPEYYPIFRVKEFTYNHIRQPNYNQLLWADATVDGIKTGHTDAAGHCLAASANRPVPDTPNVRRRLITVVMGERSEHARLQDSLKLLNYGYQAYQSVRLYQHAQPIDSARVFKGAPRTVKIGVPSDRWVTVPTGMRDKITPMVKINTPLIAPLAKGQAVGVVKVMVDKQAITTFPIVVLEEVRQAGAFGRLWDALMLLFQK